VDLMRAVVIGLNALAGLASLAMSGYGFLILLLTRMDPLRTDYVGIALGSDSSSRFWSFRHFA
jgi:hypothetical protein